MAAVEHPDEIAFLSGLKSLVGKRIRVWYDVASSESGALRETVEGRLASITVEVVLEDSRLIHPASFNDRATRTAPTASIRGYNLLDPVSGAVTRTVVRPAG
jgi:hypothetical protein